jgi:hypothetical protein
MSRVKFRSTRAFLVTAAILASTIAVGYQQPNLPDLSMSEIGQSQPVTNAPVDMG